MASTKDMTLLPREVLVAPEAIRLGGGGQVAGVRPTFGALPLPLAGEGWGGGVAAGDGVRDQARLAQDKRDGLAERPPPASLRSAPSPASGRGIQSRSCGRHAAVDHDGLAGPEAG